jgi:predicted nucleic acid-binding protein
MGGETTMVLGVKLSDLLRDGLAKSDAGTGYAGGPGSAAESGMQGRGWTDAYLAALALEQGASLATFDWDSRKYRGLRLVEL